MNLSVEELAEYREALKARVCSLCLATGYGMTCQVGMSGLCPIETHLERIVEAVLATPRSNRVEDYVPKLREIVCSHCANQDSRGVCAARDLATCGLDSFLLPVIQTVEEIHDRRQGAPRRGETLRDCLEEGCLSPR